MVKISLVAIIAVLVYSQPDLRLTVADWLKSASDFLVESVSNKQNKYNQLRFKSKEVLQDKYNK
tara:strand:- start:66 stop:257 length:192 start_codon:yes stop_codon:yes gene_type:complete